MLCQHHSDWRLGGLGLAAPRRSGLRSGGRAGPGRPGPRRRSSGRVWVRAQAHWHWLRRLAGGGKPEDWQNGVTRDSDADSDAAVWAPSRLGGAGWASGTGTPPGVTGSGFDTALT